MKSHRFLAALAIICLVITFPVMGMAQSPAPVAAPAAAVTVPAPTTQNTVTTTGPVNSTTTIETGTLASQVLAWVMSVFGLVIGSGITALIIRALKLLGLNISAGLRAKLQDIVVNGLNDGAAKVEHDIQGRGQVEVKNAIAASAVQYVQAHGADTLKALGEDPQSQKAIEAIKARIETAIADPAQPTPPVLDKTAAAPAAA